MTAAEIALDWWRAYGEGRVDELWRLSAKPVRYMLARAMVANEMNASAAAGDGTRAKDLLLACQGAALHGPSGPSWRYLDECARRFFDPIDMEPLLRSMRIFPRSERQIASFTQITFFPPDTPPMPWIVDGHLTEVVGFASVLRGADDAAALGERVAQDPIALWMPATSEQP